MLKKPMELKNFGVIGADSALCEIEKTSDGAFTAGKEGVKAILSTLDKKVELIAFENKTLAYLPSAVKYDAYYPIYPIAFQKPVKAVLMDLDGTSVKSEEFWMWIIEQTMRKMMKQPDFTFVPEDYPFIAGNSVSEHLTYCIKKYCPSLDLNETRRCYDDIINYELNEIMQGRGRSGAFVPAEHLKEFLLELKANKIRIGLVTSGLYRKAMPEIISAFRTLDMGDPNEFYDAIITAGVPFEKGKPGNMSELPIKPHPWVYAETCRFGLGIPFEERNSVVAIEDSGAGVCSARIAGFTAIGIAGGNIESSGTMDFCSYYRNSLDEVADLLLK